MTDTCKKLINDVNECVDDCLRGLVAINTGISLLNGHRVVIRSDIDEYKQRGKVAVLSGGGAGHEPAHAGYVGKGMLSGAISGAVFTSPPPASILAAIRKVGKNNSGGVLLVVKNYTGDRINFGRAAEKAKAEGIPVETVIVGEDCALTSHDKSAGRRGLCGTVFIHKIAGALAEEGKSLTHIANICREAVNNMGTIGLSLSPCSVPGSGASFHLEPQEMELGLGIHGEAGVKRVKVVSAKESVNMMLDHMTNPSSATHLNLPSGSHVAVMINNLGGTSYLELNILADSAITILEKKGLNVARAYCGAFMTSLEMAGISITVMILKEDIKKCLDAPVDAPAWSVPLLRKDQCDWVSKSSTLQCEEEGVSSTSSRTSSNVEKLSTDLAEKLKQAVICSCEAVIKAEDKLNQLDSQAGDSDCGTTLKRGATAILSSLDSMPVHVPCKLMLTLSDVIETAMGGSSGAFYSLGLSAGARALGSDVTHKGWCQALEDTIAAITHYGGAEPGDRTMLDALCAANSALKSCDSSQPMVAFHKAVEAAEAGAQATAGMKAQAGRASYVSAQHLTQPDPGAYAIGVWMRAAYQSLDQAVQSSSYF